MAQFSNNYTDNNDDSRSLSGDSSPPISSDGESETSSIDEIQQQRLELNQMEGKGKQAASFEYDVEENEDDEYIPGTFEGPEKNLCVEFKPNIGHKNGCRQLNRSSLDDICAAAKCTIMSSISNHYLDAYVLSESSLFVYKNKIIIKTCGTTTLLKCLVPLLKFTDQLGLEIDWLGYSRKNFSFPEVQIFPHSNFYQEFEYLKNHQQLEERVHGEGYILGPITKDHWLAYVCDRPSYNNPLKDDFLSDDITLNIMMFDLDEKISNIFYQENISTSKEMTEISGISNLVPGALIDDRLFEPCGYSMNAILHDTYSTIHITPEKECSYASFETNTKLKSYNSLIKNVIHIFKPKRIVITMIADENGLKTINECPIKSNQQISFPNIGNYIRSSNSSTSIAGDVYVSMGNWELKNHLNMNPNSIEKTVKQQNEFTRQRTLSF